MSTRTRLHLSAILFLLSVAPHIARAQDSTTGAIRGTITDADTGETVIGATIAVTSPALQGSQGAITDETGNYFVSNLPPGTYQLVVYYSDAQFARSNVLVQLGKTAVVNVTISTAAAGGEVIEIEGTAPLIDQGSTKTGRTITSDYTENVPSGRTFGSMIETAPGAAGDLYGTSISGSTSNENTYIVEGLNTTDPGYGLQSTNLPNEFIKETEVITGGYSAEYGRSTGGIINVITKSGSNEFHGSVFGYWTPGALVATEKKVPVAGSAISRQEELKNSMDMGVEAGGPIVKDRLWFHAGVAPAYRSTSISRIVSTQIDDNQDGIPDTDQNDFAILEELSRTRRKSTRSTAYYSGKLSGAVSEEHQGSIAALGSPTTRQYVGPVAGERSVGGFDLVDNVFDTSAKWTSKFFDNQTQVDAVVGHHFDRHGEEPTLARGDTSQIRYETGRPLSEFSAFEPGGLPSQCVDGGPDDDYPMIVNCPTDVYRIGGVGFLHDTTAKRTTAGLAVTQRVQALGHHAFKVGADIEEQSFRDHHGYTGDGWLRERASTVWTRRRFYTPDSMGTELCGNDIDQDMVPDATCARQDFLTASTQTRNLGAYVQDSWSIVSNFTLNAGVRYEQQTLYAADEVVGDIAPSTGQPIPEKAFTLSNMFAPRVGVIYDPTDEGRSKLYSHWGRFYESIPMDIASRGYGGEVLNIDVYAPGGCAVDPGASPNVAQPPCDDAALLQRIIFGDGETLHAPNLKAQYLDEVVAGGEYELREDLKVGAAYIYRDLGRIIEDISTDGGGTYIVANPGEVDRAGIRDLRAEADSIEGMEPGRAAFLRYQADQLEAVGLFDAPKRTYHGLQLTADHRFTDNVFLAASYTYSQLRGNFPGLFSPETGQLDPNFTSMYDLPELMANRYGDLAHDRPHLLKVDGFYRLGISEASMATFGGAFRVSSGIPINALGGNFAYGPRETYILPRGESGRTDPVSRFDTHLAYGRRLSDGMVLQGFVDVFNLFNQQPGVGADEEYTLDNVNPIVGGDREDLRHVKALDDNGNPTAQTATPRANWTNLDARQAPLTMRFGLRLTF